MSCSEMTVQATAMEVSSANRRRVVRCEKRYHYSTRSLLCARQLRCYSLIRFEFSVYVFGLCGFFSNIFGRSM